MRKFHAAVLVLLSLCCITGSSSATLNSRSADQGNMIMQKSANLQIPFIENQGQIKEKSVKFYANTFAGTVFVTTKGEIVYNLTNQGHNNINLNLQQSEQSRQKPGLKGLALRETLEDSLEPGLDGTGRSKTRVNYFKGPEANWRSNISAWQEVSMGEVYPGIKLNLKAYDNNVEKLFYVKPGSRPEDIKIKLSGVLSLRIMDTGELSIETDLGVVKFSKPAAYQEIDGKRVEIATNYYLPNSETPHKESCRTYSFRLGTYDKTREVVIDPLLYSTYLGGSGMDQALGGAVDSSGNMYIVGATTSIDFPTTTGAFDNSYNGGDSDLFIAKISPTAGIVYSTYFGGSSDDYSFAAEEPYAFGVTIDASGNVYITGGTSSNDFPTTPGALSRSIKGNTDAFVLKLNSTGDTLIYSTFIGGTSDDEGAGIAVDSTGNAYIAGKTWSSDFPTTPGAFDRTFNGGSSDIFAVKLNPEGGSLVYSTYLGGSGWEDASEIKIDQFGNAYILGGGDSTDYPTTAEAYDRTGDGIYFDIYLTKLNATGSAILASTFLGSSNKDWSESMAIDSNGNIFISGETYASDFPTTIGAYDSNFEDILNNACGYIAKFDTNLSHLLASTFLKGFPPSVTTDSSGNVFVSGLVKSSSFPTTPGAYDRIFHGGISTGGSFVDDICSPNGCDAFVSKLDNDLTTLLASTYLGGSGNDIGGVGIGPSGNVYVSVITTSSDLPVKDGFDNSYNGSIDVYIAVLDNNLSYSFLSVLSVTPDNQDVTKDAGTTTFSVANTGTGTMAWAAEVIEGDSWLTITSGEGGTDSGTITCNYLANTGTSSRTAVIRVTASETTGSPVDVAVTQNGLTKVQTKSMPWLLLLLE